MRIPIYIRSQLKKVGIVLKLYSKWYRLKKRWASRNTDKVFIDKYRYNQWGSLESASGFGSELAQTQQVVEQLPVMCKKFEVRSLLDLPCGDFNWMRHVKPFFPKYIGGDIVPELIAENLKKYSDYGNFITINLLKDKLPDVDAIFCRDCLVHFSYADLKRALMNIKRSGIKYIITTSYFDREKNQDIITGEWRPLNLQKPPLSFPAPLDRIIEGSTEQKGSVKDKYLGIWLVRDIPNL